MNKSEIEPGGDWIGTAELIAREKNDWAGKEENHLLQIAILREANGEHLVDIRQLQAQHHQKEEQFQNRLNEEKNHANALLSELESVKAVLSARDQEIANFHKEVESLRSTLTAKDEIIANQLKKLDELEKNANRSRHPLLRLFHKGTR